MNLDERGLSNDYIAVVAEFDVAIQPGPHRNDEQAASEFSVALTDPECTVNELKPIVYNLYPAMAAFNVANVSGVSKNINVGFNIKTLWGGGNFGVQQQKDRLTQSMQQSVYVSGYRNGESKFGWYYGPPAFVKVVRPGTYATYAIILVPRHAVLVPGGAVGAYDASTGPALPDGACPIQIQGSSFWVRKGRVKEIETEPGLINNPNRFLPSDGPPKIAQVQYTPQPLPPLTSAPSTLPVLTPAAPAPTSATPPAPVVNLIGVEFERPINPNLMITVNGTLLKRVRDSRGRATNNNDLIPVVDSQGNTSSVSRQLGLFETDISEPNSWMQVNQSKLLLKVSATTAGTLQFPDVRFLVPGGPQWGMTDLVDYSTYKGVITIGSLSFYGCHPKLNAFHWSADPEQRNDGCMAQPASMWIPLFSLPVDTAHTLSASPVNTLEGPLELDAPDNSGNANLPPGVVDGGSLWSRTHYLYLSLDGGATKLDPHSQVTVISPGHTRYAHPLALECAAMAEGLLCHTHPQAIVFSSPFDRHVGATGAPSQGCLTVEPVEGVDRIFYDPLSLANVHGTRAQDCDWRQYRLQIQVVQAQQPPGQGPISAVTDYPVSPTGELSAFQPILGVVKTVRKNTNGWFLEVPVYYYPGLPPAGQTVCVAADETALTNAIIQPSVRGDTRRTATLQIQVPANDPGRIFQAASLAVYLTTCAAIHAGGTLPGNLATNYIGSFAGLRSWLQPSGVVLTKTGANDEFFQLSGANLDKVDTIVTLGDGTTSKKTGIKTVAAVASDTGVLFDVTNLTQTKDAILYYDQGGVRSPVIACSNQLVPPVTAPAVAVQPSTVQTAQLPTTQQVCGPVVLAAPIAKKVTSPAPSHKAAVPPKAAPAAAGAAANAKQGKANATSPSAPAGAAPTQKRAPVATPKK